MSRTQVNGNNILDDSVKGVDIDESTLVDSLIPFSDSDFSALNIHDGIIEAKNNSLVSDTISSNVILKITKPTQYIVADCLYNYGMIRNLNILKVV